MGHYYTIYHSKSSSDYEIFTQNILCTLVLCITIANVQAVVDTQGNLTINCNSKDWKILKIICK